MVKLESCNREPILFSELLASSNPNTQLKNQTGFVYAMLSLGPNTIANLASTTGAKPEDIRDILRNYGDRLMHRLSHENDRGKEFILRDGLSRRPDYNDGSWKPGLG
jgi:hypothetical protein